MLLSPCRSLVCATIRPACSVIRSELARSLTVLALESSADDSCASIVNSNREILSNVVVKQHHLNVKHGGIHPLEAQHAHERNVPRAVKQALLEAKMGISDIDAIAYTRGPGMYACLGVSAASAKALGAGFGKPVIGIHHMQAHALTPLLTEEVPPRYPFLVLLVSGGHTQLVLASGLDKFSILADTLDNKIGDVFDKAARLLDLPSSTQASGAVIEHYASLPPLPPFDNNPSPPLATSLPDKSRIAFSFSGILTATSRRIDKLRETVEGEALKREISRIFQEAVVGHLCRKVGHAMASLEPVGGLVVSGGVASNQFLRKALQETMIKLNPNLPTPLYFPPIQLCTDNAAMIAWTAILRIQADPGLLKRDGEGYDLPLRPKWSLETLYDDLDQVD